MDRLKARRAWLRAAGAAGIAPFMPTVAAQTATAFPGARPIRWLVAYAPGGGTDFVARLVSIRVAKYLGQAVLIENRPGASTVIAAHEAARARPDGYTVFSADNGSLIFNPLLMPRLSYRVGDFAPIGLIAEFPLLLVTGPDGPGDWAALRRKMQAEPGSLSYATPGSRGPHHIAMALLLSRCGCQARHIPYNGANPAIQDLLGGTVSMMVADTAVALALVRAGRLRALTALTTARLAALPEVPTAEELGLEGIATSAWQGLVVPAATPLAVRNQIGTALGRALRDPDVRRLLADYGVTTGSGRAAELSLLIDSETARWRAVLARETLRLES